jgi:uncharacterized membrane protein YesL
MSFYGNSSNQMFNRMMDTLNDIAGYVFLNIFWFVFSLPIVTIFPATGALYFATNEIAHHRVGNFSTFWEGFKRYFWTSYKWGLLLVVSIYLFNLNIWFYSQLDWQYGRYIKTFFIGLAILWAAMIMFIFPLLLEQEKPTLVMAVRNSFVMVSRSPLRAFGLLILIAVIAWISTYIFLPLWVTISLSLVTFLSNRGTIWILDTLPKPKEQDENQGES